MLRQPSNHLRNCHQIESPKLPAFFLPAKLQRVADLASWWYIFLFIVIIYGFCRVAALWKTLLSSACGKLENQSLLLQHLGQNLVAALL